MAKQIYIDENGNENLVSGTINTGKLLPMSTTEPTSMVADRIEACEPKIYFVNDTLLNASGGTIRGFGSAMVTLSSGKARIDFTLKITVTESGSGVNTWGINRDYFTAVTGKTISPQNYGTCIYYDTNGAILESRTDLGGSFLQNGQFWQPARVYDDSGTKKVGGWGSATFANVKYISGICYGTYT